MTDKQTGGPAFPTPVQHNDWREDYPGMTLRDYFAAEAMKQAMNDPSLITYANVSEEAYKMADAMLCTRERS